MTLTLTAGTAHAAARPPTPDQVKQARCVAVETVKLVKQVERTVWKDRQARQQAITAALKQAKFNCAPTPDPTKGQYPTSAQFGFEPGEKKTVGSFCGGEQDKLVSYRVTDPARVVTALRVERNGVTLDVHNRTDALQYVTVENICQEPR